ncbi:MAG: 4-alpha-glucanotransferase [Candidatus Sumerlaeaceae bacterium]|nr:4-alpha-glucanotransferase [Candidatus Sumerlaeaceae bacterium]
MPLDQRLAGLLLHPTSLPGPYGIGDLGPAAYRFLDWLQAADMAYWQVLPLGPTSYGDSPYQCFSAFAGNPMLVSPELLVNDGILTAHEIVPPAFPETAVDYGWVIFWKTDLFKRAQGDISAMVRSIVELRNLWCVARRRPLDLGQPEFQCDLETQVTVLDAAKDISQLALSPMTMGELAGLSALPDDWQTVPEYSGDTVSYLADTRRTLAIT